MPAKAHNAAQLGLMEDALRENRNWLVEDIRIGGNLDTQQYKQMTVRLGLLLLDKSKVKKGENLFEQSVLFDYAKARGKTLHAFFPNPEPRRTSSPSEFLWDNEFMRWEPVAGWDRVHGRAILKRKILTTPYKTLPGFAVVSVAALITQIANRSGVRHVELHARRRIKLDALARTGSTGNPEKGTSADSIEAKIAVLDIAEWAVRAIDYVLAQ